MTLTSNRTLAVALIAAALLLAGCGDQAPAPAPAPAPPSIATTPTAKAPVAAEARDRSGKVLRSSDGRPLSLAADGRTLVDADGAPVHLDARGRVAPGSAPTAASSKIAPSQTPPPGAQVKTIYPKGVTATHGPHGEPSRPATPADLQVLSQRVEQPAVWLGANFEGAPAMMVAATVEQGYTLIYVKDTKLLAMISVIPAITDSQLAQNTKAGEPAPSPPAGEATKTPLGTAYTQTLKGHETTSLRVSADADHAQQVVVTAGPQTKLKDVLNALRIG